MDIYTVSQAYYDDTFGIDVTCKVFSSREEADDCVNTYISQFKKEHDDVEIIEDKNYDGYALCSIAECGEIGCDLRVQHHTL